MSVPEIPEVPEDLGADMDSFQEETPPSPPSSYLSMESEEEKPVKADKEHVCPPVGVDPERADSPDTRQGEIEECSVQPKEGVFLPEHGPDAAQKPVSPRELLEFNSLGLDTEENLSPMEIPYIFKSIQRTLQQLNGQELSLFKNFLSRKHSRYFDNQIQMGELDVLDVVDKMLERCGKVIAIKVAMHVLKCMKRNDLADILEEKSRRVMIQYELKEHLRMKYDTIFEGIPKHGQHCFLSKIHVDVLMTEGGHGEINDDHEVMPNEMAAPGGQSRPILPRNLFEPSFFGERKIRTVLTRGIAGIGLTVAVQKFIVDWIEEKANRDIHYVFPLPFLDQNLVRLRDLTLIEYLTIYYPEIKNMDFIEHPDCKVLFIFDGIDEYRHPLSFQTNGIWTDPKAPTSIDMLVTNMIRGNLFPSIRFWITARTAASTMMPMECVDLLTQVHGFTESQRDQYYMKKVSDQAQARKILAHVKSSKSLYIMSHVPVYSWILVTVFERQIFVENQEESPLIMTQLFTHYMLLQTNMMHSKYQGKHSIPEWTETDRDFLMKLGKLGLHLLEKGRKEFNLGDLKDVGLEVKDAIVQSGLCTELFPRHAQSQQRVFRFIHLSVQEHLAAFYVYMTFRVKHNNVLVQALVGPHSKLFKEPTLVDLLCSAVDKALQSPNGHLDLFLRFLLGLSVDSTQRLFRPFIKIPDTSVRSIEETVGYIKKKIQENANPERCRNLPHCLIELEG